MDKKNNDTEKSKVMEHTYNLPESEVDKTFAINPTLYKVPLGNHPLHEDDDCPKSLPKLRFIRRFNVTRKELALLDQGEEPINVWFNYKFPNKPKNKWVVVDANYLKDPDFRHAYNSEMERYYKGQDDGSTE